MSQQLKALKDLREAIDQYFGPSKAGAAWPKYFDGVMMQAYNALSASSNTELPQSKRLPGAVDILIRAGHSPEEAAQLIDASPLNEQEVQKQGSIHDAVRIVHEESGRTLSKSDFDLCLRIARRALSHADPVLPAQAHTFQNRVQPWMMECFGAEISSDKMERNHRFFEESTELVQACGMTASEAHQLVDYVYGRPVGEPNQEAGGVMVTLAALCLAQKLDMHEAGEIELARIWTKVEKIRAKQAAKPKHSPLPEATQPTGDADTVNAQEKCEHLLRTSDGKTTRCDICGAIGDVIIEDTEPRWRALSTVQPAPQQPSLAQVQNPLSSRCYVMTERHLSGYRMIVGFETLTQVQAAHEYVLRQIPLQSQTKQSTEGSEG